MPSINKRYKEELLNYLGRFYQDNIHWQLKDLPPRIIDHIDQIRPFLINLEEDGYIEIIDLEKVVFNILQPPPSPKTYL